MPLSVKRGYEYFYSGHAYQQVEDQPTRLFYASDAPPPPYIPPVPGPAVSPDFVVPADYNMVEPLILNGPVRPFPQRHYMIAAPDLRPLYADGYSPDEALNRALPKIRPHYTWLNQNTAKTSDKWLIEVTPVEMHEWCIRADDYFVYQIVAPSPRAAIRQICSCGVLRRIDDTHYKTVNHTFSVKETFSVESSASLLP